MLKRERSPNGESWKLYRPLILYPGVALVLIAINPVLAVLWIFVVVPVMREDW